VGPSLVSLGDNSNREEKKWGNGTEGQKVGEKGKKKRNFDIKSIKY
jgi:hypothetical protein